MSYSFVQIEQSKSRTIQWSLAFLAVLYALGALLIVWVVKYFIFGRVSSDQIELASSPLSLLDLPTVLWTLGAALCLSAVHWFSSTDALIDKTLQYMSGRIADENVDDERVFRHVVEEAAVATGGKYHIEPYLIPTAAMNAFALQDFQGRSVIGITEGLLKRLNREQLEAVIAHEAGHIATGDCLETTVTSVVFKAFDTICDISRRMLFFGNISGNDRSSSRRESGGSLMILMLVIFLIALVLKFIGYLGSLFISREREYRADAMSVQLTRNPLALAEALHIIDQRWKGGGMPGEAMDAIFILSPRQSAYDDQEDVFSDLFSTHPPIKKRIGILLDMAHAKAGDLDQALARARSRFETLHADPLQPDSTLNSVPSVPVPVPLGMPGASSNMPFPLGNPTMPTAKDHCPRCQTALEPETYEGVQIKKCPSCQGSLVGEMDVLHIVGTKEEHFDDRIHELARITRQQVKVLQSNPFDRIYDQQSIVCPSCLDPQKKMTRRFVSPKYPVEVDKCKTCARVWFDKDELEILQCLYESDQSAVKS
ncbi:MAG: M48 family metalloprotease [Candidatus Omnitrophica bacterium]|nr:M48 family metalloprotease [Candidatus Omnitrophota bacterium]